MLNSDENKLRLDRWSSSLLRGPPRSNVVVLIDPSSQISPRLSETPPFQSSAIFTFRYFPISWVLHLYENCREMELLSYYIPFVFAFHFGLLNFVQFWDNDGFIPWKPLSDLSDWQEPDQMSLKRNEWLCKGLAYLFRPIIFGHINVKWPKRYDFECLILILLQNFSFFQLLDCRF